MTGISGVDGNRASQAASPPDPQLEAVIAASERGGRVDYQLLGQQVGAVARQDPAAAKALQQHLERAMTPVQVGEFRAGLARPAAQAPSPPLTAAQRAEQRELLFDLAQMGLDITGIVDPTPLSDGANALISAGRGDGVGFVVGVVSIVPGVGDLAKAAKATKWAKTASRTIEMAKIDPAFAAKVRPMLEQARDALNNALQNGVGGTLFKNLPAGAQNAITRVKNQLDEALGLTSNPRAFVPSKTEPTGPKGGVPRGDPAEVKPELDRQTREGYQFQNESADILAAKGYQVRHIENTPLNDAERLRHGIAPKKNPDYMIEGRVFDSLAPHSDTIEGTWRSIQDKVVSGQTHRLVVNLGRSDFTAEQIRQELRKTPIAGLQEVLVIDKSKDITRIFP